MVALHLAFLVGKSKMIEPLDKSKRGGTRKREGREREREREERERERERLKEVWHQYG